MFYSVHTIEMLHYHKDDLGEIIHKGHYDAKCVNLLISFIVMALNMFLTLSNCCIAFLRSHIICFEYNITDTEICTY